ncbi:MAG: M23 family metallopeptidase [Gammaproteobacteria bacterium]|jgi:murein DD-endopeptidase MepM/ murein hydrolase activator NlpD|nr:M23 family metallopeptidase [Gammaproteobacteria bacterium]
MNIILFTNKRGQVWNFDVNLLHASLTVVFGLVVLLAAAVYAGVLLGSDELHNVANWQDSVSEQQAEITEARLSAQADIDALTLRVGQMQAQMLRLNALGGRLVSQSDLDKDEFDFDAVPAVGGPEDVMNRESVPLADFLSMLEQLETEMVDREQKLSVLESLLMSRSLSERVTPSGRPVEEGWLSSRYGKRNDPFTGKQDFHKGLDFAGKKGSEVIAVGDGVVSWAGVKSGYGKLIEINHGNGYATRYGHNQSNLVKIGDTVKKGQQIALMGSTGRSTGPHVHFEVLHDGKAVNPSKFVAE